MPKLKPDTQRARREHILDAAERCFARAGFHATTMQDICKEASVSPGALYVYFASKEALIAGLCERNRAEFQSRFADLATARDFMAALACIGEHYFVEEPPHKQLMCVEMGIEFDAQRPGRPDLPLGRQVRLRQLRADLRAPRRPRAASRPISISQRSPMCSP